MIQETRPDTQTSSAVILEDERGRPLEEAADPKNLLHRLLPLRDTTGYQCLRFIDWYGDTTFNRLQMEIFIAEWKQLGRIAQSDEEKNLLARIENFAKRCKNEPHLFKVGASGFPVGDHYMLWVIA